MPESILGISAYYHDSAAVLLMDSDVIAAAHEERFTRKKHDSGFPSQAIRYVLSEGGLALDELDAVVFYDKPFLKFERLLETYHAFAPKGLISFMSAIPVWIKEKLFLKRMLKNELNKLGLGKVNRILFPEHHHSHAASAFYPSPFEEAAILTVDGVGEWATATIGHGSKNKIRVIKQLDFPHSLGLLYSAFTYYCGFRVNSGEYKLMGLAPYGNPESEQTRRWIDAIYNEMVDIREDGSFLLNMKYFDYATGLRMCNEKRWKELFGITKREPETELTSDYTNLAYAIQHVTEDIILRLARTAKEITNSNYLCLAGGVSLNCVANGKLLRSGIFKDIWIQPASGDAGGALGATLAAWYLWKDKSREVLSESDSMQGSLLGPQFYDNEIERIARKYSAPFKYYSSFDELCSETANILGEGKIIGWFQGRMEYGPRALGNRSILADPRNPEMQKKLNLKIKYREGFRPFAPSVLEEDIDQYFDLDRPSPYMLLVAQVKNERCNEYPDDYTDRSLQERLYFKRSDIPALTHIDYSARIQSVNKNINLRYWKLINAFKTRTGYGVSVNTSFNVRGEPIVCTPEDAYTCFMRTEMDCLVMGDFMFIKSEQPLWKEEKDWKNSFKLD